MIFLAKVIGFVFFGLFLQVLTDVLFGIPEEYDWLAFMVAMTYAAAIVAGVNDD